MIENQRKVHNVYLDNLVLQPRLTLLLLAGGADGGEVGDDLLGVLRLARSRLAAVTRELAVDLTIKGWVIPPPSPSCGDSVHCAQSHEGVFLGIMECLDS